VLATRSSRAKRNSLLPSADKFTQPISKLLPSALELLFIS
jgi:hypothetical protein